MKIGGVNHKGYYREQFMNRGEAKQRLAGSATGATGATAQVSGKMAGATDALPERDPDDEVDRRAGAAVLSERGAVALQGSARVADADSAP